MTILAPMMVCLAFGLLSGTLFGVFIGSAFRDWEDDSRKGSEVTLLPITKERGDFENGRNEDINPDKSHPREMP